MRNKQVGPDDKADILANVVHRATYRDWTLRLAEVSRGQGCEGLTLMISAKVPDSWGKGMIEFCHLMPVPPAAYDEDTWTRWVFDQIMLVELHEAMEFFKVDGQAPFFPEHGPGRNPYTIAQVKTPDQAYAEATPWVGGGTTDEHFQGD